MKLIREMAIRKGIVAAGFLILAFIPPVSVTVLHAASLEEAIKDKLEFWIPSFRIVREGTPSLEDMLKGFYMSRNFRALWNDSSSINSPLNEFLDLIASSRREGLRPEHYNFFLLKEMWSREDLTLEEKARREIFTTEMFLLYACDLAWGRFDPKREFFQWSHHRRAVDPYAVLRLVAEGESVTKAISSLDQNHPSYKALKSELQKYREIAKMGGWSSIPTNVNLRKGKRSPLIHQLKERLLLSGDLRPEDVGDVYLFDDKLERAVRLFQWRHGIAPTGVVSGETVKELNVHVSERIRQIEINLERWRWYPDSFGARYILVIIPEFLLYAVEGGRTELSMKVVVGTKKQPSPVFSDIMKYVELNPAWNIPVSIVEKEVIPELLKDPDYLQKKRIRVFSDWSPNAREIDPKTINWRKINPDSFPFRITQDPGVNPLGHIKFVFPNQFDVYLHDTTQRSLFRYPKRMFSHGCIRVERPYDLAAWVLKSNSGWDRTRIVKEVKRGKRQVVALAETVPVHVLYLTAWVDGNGFLHFREDVYGLDGTHERTLDRLRGAFNHGM
ncbi:MAG: L,D-transpeptidase family protein [Syntrophales bacterium]|nr:L,D-transpeptidase family protein [Syntrophales bacterium]